MIVWVHIHLVTAQLRAHIIYWHHFVHDNLLYMTVYSRGVLLSYVIFYSLYQVCLYFLCWRQNFADTFIKRSTITKHFPKRNPLCPWTSDMMAIWVSAFITIIYDLHLWYAFVDYSHNLHTKCFYSTFASYICTCWTCYLIQSTYQE